MIKLTPQIILKFQSIHRVKETYEIVLKNVVDLCRTIMDEREIREAKLHLKEAIAVLEDKENQLYERRKGW